MKVRVLLLSNVKGLGNAKSIVSVSRGYAFNYLIPKGLAKIISDDFEETIVSESKNVEDAKVKRAIREKDTLESKTLIFKAKAGEGDKLFGSITTSEISDKIKSVFGLEIDKKKIELESSIKKLGYYAVKVKLYKDIEALLKVIVEKE